jgi:hypothetical protein
MTAGVVSSYLTSLRSEQAKLALAEAQIPRRASSPATLARSIALLEAAVARLSGDLGAIKPPAAVKALHGRLIAVAGWYAVKLSQIQRQAASPRGEVAGAGDLVSDTAAASHAFTSTMASIEATLRRG